MNEVVAKALRALAEAGIGMREPEQAELGGVRKPSAQGTVDLTPRKPDSPVEKPDLPDSILMARNPLKEICRLTLEGNPEAHRLSPDGRRWIGEHLETAVLKWLAHVLKPEPAWDAICPKGHRITEGVFARCLLGWCCEQCKQVFPASECKLRVRE